MYADYKGGRAKTPDEFREQFPFIRELLDHLGIRHYELAQYEADDIIGTLAKRAAEDGFDVYMVTPDKDYAQLVTDKVFMYKPARMGNGSEILNPEKVREKFGIEPERVVDFLLDLLRALVDANLSLWPARGHLVSPQPDKVDVVETDR